MNDKCAYCGRHTEKMTRDHVVPRCLYPESRRQDDLQLLTVPACRTCNESWTDDEVQFRDMLLTAGEPNEAVSKIWEEKTCPSFDHADGNKRLQDLWDQMVPTVFDGRRRYQVFPGSDERVRRVVRKIVRGLCYDHDIISPVPDDLVWVDVLRFRFPKEILPQMNSGTIEKDIFCYWYSVLGNGEPHSLWFLQFFEKRIFIGVVCHSEEYASSLRRWRDQFYEEN